MLSPPQRSKLLAAALMLTLPAAPTFAQHDHHHPNPSPSPTPSASPSAQTPEPDHDHDMMHHEPTASPEATPQASSMPEHEHGPDHHMPQMPQDGDHEGHGDQADHSDHSSHTIHGALMERARTLGSGTSVLPQTSPMRMWSWDAGDWLLMLHGDAVLGYNQQGGKRFDQAHAAENWAMFMATRYLGPGILDLRAMGSLEALTLPPGGTPELFQTGETWQGRALIDKQHPHDLLMELAARYTWKPLDDLSVFGYAALAGEPALGPVAFMHRPSSADNHWAPLSHHLQDSTHISFGVGTLGLRWQTLQLEASLFNAREPDENRFNIDFGPLDSWSTRLSWAPTDQIVAQISYGQLNDPEMASPGDIHRTTASVSHVLPLPADTLGGGYWSNSAVWGMNQEFHETPSTFLNSFGLESQLDWDQARNHAYTRLELVDKTGLDLDGSGHDHSVHKVFALTLGGVRDLDDSPYYDLGVGSDLTFYFGDEAVRTVYGNLPVGFRAYLRFRPPLM